MTRFFLLIFLLQSFFAFSQLSYNGKVLDDKTSPVAFATVALLEPSDSTLAYYAVTNTDGDFSMKGIKAGNYVLQLSFLGFKTIYRNVDLNSVDERENVFIMQPAPVNLPAAEVSSERIPLQIKGDTVEYNAASYKTGPDAVTEDLLKKLPGVAVDRNGNIKAQGEDVKKVTVDGKEFFGNDPKVATRNLPADAINKVQVFDTKSDQAELTGINDGERNKTINLQLKDDRKSAWFGEVMAGAGTDDHYQANAKAYRFTPEKQVAFLGMLNNINKFGFSFSDYMDFSGGFRGGESFRLNVGDNSMPINFGQVEKGLITSGGGGANYSIEKRKDNRFNVSYLANGIDKTLNENSSTTSFTDTQKFFSVDDSYNKTGNRAHRINLGWKNRIDSMNTLNIRGQGSMSDNQEKSSSSNSNFSDDEVASELNSNNSSDGDQVSASLSADYLKKLNSRLKLFSFSADGSYQHSLSRNDINTITKFYSPASEVLISNYRRNKSDMIKYSAETGLTLKIGEFSYLEGSVSAGMDDEIYSREQGNYTGTEGPIDSLSDELNRKYQWARPGLDYRRIKDKSQLNLSLGTHFLHTENNIENSATVNYDKMYLLPEFSWEKEYNTSGRLRFVYESTVETPTARQLFPLVDYADPLNQFAGNQNLKPELHNDLRFHWSLFDQFSFTSIFTGLRLSYIKDKISWMKTVDDNFVQTTRLINVDEEYQANLSAEYSTPIRKLGINITLSVDERWTQTLTNVNGKMNTNKTLSHEGGISFDNRKKNKWDASTGVTLRYDRSLLTLSSTNDGYIRADVFADVSYSPVANLKISAKAELSRYYGNVFGESVSVPLLHGDITYSFLKHKRGSLIFSAFDILNRNAGIERISEFNYFTERKSDIIQRYFMLSFRYKLNKFTSGGNFDVKVKH